MHELEKVCEDFLFLVSSLHFILLDSLPSVWAPSETLCSCCASFLRGLKCVASLGHAACASFHGSLLIVVQGLPRQECYCSRSIWVGVGCWASQSRRQLAVWRLHAHTGTHTYTHAQSFTHTACPLLASCHTPDRTLDAHLFSAQEHALLSASASLPAPAKDLLLHLSLRKATYFSLKVRRVCCCASQPTCKRRPSAHWHAATSASA